jgi:hypothetical protein
MTKMVSFTAAGAIISIHLGFLTPRYPIEYPVEYPMVHHTLLEIVVSILGTASCLLVHTINLLGFSLIYARIVSIF